ncbi:hypothetical protein PCE1_000143 [Barthelona sp. PCE]
MFSFFEETNEHQHPVDKNIITPGRTPANLKNQFGSGLFSFRGNAMPTACFCGPVTNLEQHTFVNPYQKRYSPQSGDTVIGKVIEVSDDRWKIDIGAHLPAYLNVTQILETAGRMFNDTDSLSMRTYLEEGDWVIAFINKTPTDEMRSIQLNTTSEYKLTPGLVQRVRSRLVQAVSSSFKFPYDNPVIDVKVAKNGYIWLRPVENEEKSIINQAVINLLSQLNSAIMYLNRCEAPITYENCHCALSVLIEGIGNNTEKRIIDALVELNNK